MAAYLWRCGNQQLIASFFVYMKPSSVICPTAFAYAFIVCFNCLIFKINGTASFIFQPLHFSVGNSGSNHRCKKCDKEIDFPLHRLSLELMVEDSTACVLIVLFDKVAEFLLK